MRHDGSQLLCVSLHDVAPATYDECVVMLEFLDRLRVGPVALLVVPDYHLQGRVDRDQRFCDFLHERTARGDEIVLHGLHHVDRSPPPRTPLDWLVRRLYTAGEGEFARLDREAARVSLLRGLAVLRAAGCRPSGFVAPAWLMSYGTREALDAMSLRYFATRSWVVPLDGSPPVHAPSLVASSRSAWRRTVSPWWCQASLNRWAGQHVLRAALHPVDVRYPSLWRAWRRLFGQLANRTVVTEGALVGSPEHHAIVRMQVH